MCRPGIAGRGDDAPRLAHARLFAGGVRPSRRDSRPRAHRSALLLLDHPAPGRAFLRYDPGCLEALDERGRSAMRFVEARIADAPSEAHHWRQGDILIIDNWRVLHGRSPSDRGSGRRIARILIDA
ncbi:TauD/TfdA family dioxygenase [Phyllobacterium sp. 22229]|uniref:TauD/TfdA family dioxygenase n=1 Tax=Agrobacterium radiobacter TaxID=362 RepID=A0ABD5LMN7_AGRRD